ncbi:MAG: hypothetical protein ABI333_17085 [bacterium]
MKTEKLRTLILSGLLAASLVAVAILALKLYRIDADLTATRRNAWKSCRKVSMQHLLFERARERARAEGKQLVVIGNPTGGWVNKVATVYGCGDICIDIAGCSPCGDQSRILKADAIVALKTLPSDSAVVFESETLEYVFDMKAATRELARITGNDHTRIYSVHSISIDHWRYHTKGVRPKPPTKAAVRKRRKHRKKYANTGEGLARRIIYNYPPRDPYRWVDL